MTIKCRLVEDRRVPGIRLATIFRAKGLEFMAVALVAMNDSVVPNVMVPRAVPDEAGRAEVMDTEHMLVYGAATPAMKRLLVTSSGKPRKSLKCNRSTSQLPGWLLRTCNSPRLTSFSI